MANGTGKTHISIALRTNLVNQGKRVRFHNAVDLINALIAEQADGNTGKIIKQLTALECVIIDELGYIPFPKSGGSLVRRGIDSPDQFLIRLTPSDQQTL